MPVLRKCPPGAIKQEIQYMPLNTNIWTGNLPVSIAQLYKGKASVIPLDYASRYEYSIVLQPDNWDDMHALIKSPAEFLEWARLSFSQTPAFTVQGQSVQQWLTRAPLTIVVSPLTIPTTSNFAWLSVLGIDNASEMYSLDPGKYADSVMAQATSLFPTEGPRGNPRGKHWMGCRGVFIAEFALLTRVLNIFYLPPTFPPKTYAPRWYLRQITPLTISKLGNTKLTLLHFDVDFGGKWTHQDVADARASLTMDYIENPSGFLNYLFTHKINLSANNASQPSSSPVFWDGSPLKKAKATMADTTAQIVPLGVQPVTAPPTIRHSRLPRVTIDSVWPNSRQPVWTDSRTDWSTAGTVPTPPPPPPYICIKVETESDPASEELAAGDEVIKYYSEPPGRIDGNPVGPDNGNPIRD